MDFQQIRKYVKGVLTNSFLNKTTLDKLSTSNEGNLLFDGKEISGGLHEYSTEEQIVGTWIDGKPIYERVFTDVNVSLATADWHYVNVTIDNFKFVIDSFGFDGTYQCFKPFGASNNNNQLWWRHNNVNNTINIITVQYTKTTD